MTGHNLVFLMMGFNDGHMLIIMVIVFRFKDVRYKAEVPFGWEMLEFPLESEPAFQKPENYVVKHSLRS